ncbi:MAG: carboxypeptidase-like regulatory domain-containing protein [Saprospiraceae bacterium]
MKKIILLVLATILVFASCKKDSVIIDDMPPPIDNTRNFINVNTSVAGLVVDVNNIAISGANVSFGNEMTTTDANGIFKFENVTVLENRAFVKVEKDGYFHGSRTFFAFADQRSNVKISLLEKTIQGTVGASGGTVTTPEGVKLEFPANAVADANGNPYTGTVEVAAQYLDPTADNISSIMPGDLRGITTDNVEEGLTTYGMVAVELLGSGGELLNVADGKTVQLTMPVGSTQSSSAPAEIPLWYFDETNGVWKEEGKATLQGDEYVGDVSHFTYWNCDINWDLIYLDGSVLLDGVELEGATVCLTFDNNGWASTACDVTNTAGVFSGQVPANTTFTLNVYAGSFNNCGDAIHSQEIGPFTADVTLDPINIDPSTVADNSLTITGTLVDCDNNPVTNGYAKIKLGWAEYYAYTTDGTIDYTFIHCGITADVEITAVDLAAFTQSDATIFTNASTVDFGELQACISLAEYIIFDYNGTTTNLTEYVSLFDSLGTGAGYHYLYGNDAMQNNFSLEAIIDGPGTFDVLSFYFSTSNGVSVSGTDMTITVDNYSAVIGETNSGTFTGNVDDPNGGGTLPITGSWKAIREF